MKTSEFIKQAARGDQAIKMIKAITNRATNGNHFTNIAHQALGGVENKLRPSLKSPTYSFKSDYNPTSVSQRLLGVAQAPKGPSNQTDATFLADMIRSWRAGKPAPGFPGAEAHSRLPFMNRR